MAIKQIERQRYLERKLVQTYRIRVSETSKAEGKLNLYKVKAKKKHKIWQRVSLLSPA